MTSEPTTPAYCHNGQHHPIPSDYTTKPVILRPTIHPQHPALISPSSPFLFFLPSTPHTENQCPEAPPLTTPSNSAPSAPSPSSTHFHPNWGGTLILNIGLIDQSIPLASTIAGAVCLSLEPDPATARQALRTGACDFVVNTLDEALRAMKNQVRQAKPLSVGLQGNQSQILNEILERGVAPQLVTNLTDPTALPNPGRQRPQPHRSRHPPNLHHRTEPLDRPRLPPTHPRSPQILRPPGRRNPPPERHPPPHLASRRPPPVPPRNPTPPHPLANPIRGRTAPQKALKTKTHANRQTSPDKPRSGPKSHLSKILRKTRGEGVYSATAIKRPQSALVPAVRLSRHRQHLIHPKLPLQRRHTLSQHIIR